MDTPSRDDNNQQPLLGFVSGRSKHAAPTYAALLETLGSVNYRPLPERSDRFPSRDELWRLSWEGTSRLGVIADTGTEAISVRPVLVDAEPDDDRCLWADALQIGWDDPIVVIDVVFAVPLFVLDARIGDGLINIHEGSWVRGDDPSEVTDDLIRDFESFRTAEWWISGTYRVEAPAEELIRQVGLRPERVMDLVEGARPTSEEAAAIRSAVGSGALRVVDAPPPVVGLLNDPVQKAKIVRWSTIQGVSEAEGRRRIAEATELVAARGAKSETDRLSAALDNVLA